MQLIEDGVVKLKIYLEVKHQERKQQIDEVKNSGCGRTLKSKGWVKYGKEIN